MSYKICPKAVVFVVAVVLLALPLHADYLCGDADGSGEVNVGDLSFLVTYLFLGGPPPDPPASGDCDSDGEVNVADLSYLVSYLFLGGIPPCAGPSGEVLGRSECKTYRVDSAPPNLDCMEYAYNGTGVLTLKHVNAGFNCCPGTITADISIAGGLITIAEAEVYDSLGPCFCLCLFDVDMQIVDLPEGEYTIRVIEPYVNAGDDTLRFTVNLTTSPDSGLYCVERDHYPWGDFSGSPVEYGTCKTFMKTQTTDTIPSHQDCIEYEYDGYNLLTIRHINAGFNCCPDLIDVTVQHIGDTIIVEEFEYLYTGGCDCLCLFDLNYSISGVAPGECHIEVIEPYAAPGDEPLVFDVTLPNDPVSDIFCVLRTHYPWGQ